MTFKDYGGGPARLAAVKSGEIKATMLNEPFNSFAREQGVNVLIDLAAEQMPWVFSGITVRTSALMDGASATSSSASSRRRSKATISRSPTRSARRRRWPRNCKITIRRSSTSAYNDFKEQSPLNLEPTRKGAENILAQFPGGSSKVEDYIDTSLLDEIKAEGFFTQMQQKYNKR